MNPFTTPDFKLGILGGGQLGKMLLQASSNWHLNTAVLEPNEEASAAHLCTTFVKGSFTNYDDVLAFGKTVDVLTIEIENVNTKALAELEKAGKAVHPCSRVIQLIQDKGLQKEFYQEHNLPSSEFKLFENSTALKAALKNGEISYPFVQKLRKEGYDGKGVLIVKSEADLAAIFDQPSVVEQLVDIEKELSIVVARNGRGEIQLFPVVEMEFNPTANLVEFLSSPADIDEKTAMKAKEIGLTLIEALDMQGILAIELFLTKNQEVLINEVAPRPHNSGHQTIEATITSQYEQHLRAILNLPLGSTAVVKPAVMVNLLGEEGHTGPAVYHGLEEVLDIEGAKVHLYGKKQTKPFRKMGHVTVIDDNISEARKKASAIKNTLKIKS